MTPVNAPFDKVSTNVLVAHRDASARLAAAERLADQPGPPVPALTLLAWDDDPEVRAAAVPQRAFDAVQFRLAFLAKDSSVANREQAARSTDSTYILALLAKDESPAVRSAVAANFSSPRDVLERLSRDESLDVRIAVAQNTDCADVILDRLVAYGGAAGSTAEKTLADRERSRQFHLNDYRDANAFKQSLAIRALLHTDTGDTEIIAELARHAASLGVTRVLEQPWIPESAMQALADNLDTAPDVLTAIANNRSASPDVLERVAERCHYRGHLSAEFCAATAAAMRNPRMRPEYLEHAAHGRTPYEERLCDTEIEAAWGNPAMPDALMRQVPIRAAAKRGLAGNVNAPSDVLEALAADTSWDVRAVAAGNQRTPRATLATLARNPSESIAIALVNNAETPPEALENLLEDDYIRARYARGPVPSPSTLSTLATTDRNLAVRTAAFFNSRTPDDAAQIASADEELRLHVNAGSSLVVDAMWHRQVALNRARTLDTQAEPLRRPLGRTDAAATLIAGLPADDRFRLAGAGPRVVVEHDFSLAELANDPLPSVRASVAGSRHCPEDLREHFAGDEHPEVRDAVATWTASPTTASRLASDAPPVWALADNYCTPGRVLAALVGASEFARYRGGSVARHPNALPATLDRLAHATEATTRAMVARHPSTARETLSALAQDTEREVRQYVAAHSDTSPTALASLATDDTEDVRLIVAANPHTSTETIRGLINDPSPRVRQVLAVSARPGLDAWSALLLDTDQATSEIARKRVPRDVRDLVRYGASTATHPVMLEYLAREEAPEVRLAVAANTATPPHVLAKLVRDPLPDVRRSLTRRADCPRETLESLAADAKWGVRRAARAALRRAAT